MRCKAPSESVQHHMMTHIYSDDVLSVGVLSFSSEHLHACRSAGDAAYMESSTSGTLVMWEERDLHCSCKQERNSYECY